MIESNEKSKSVWLLGERETGMRLYRHYFKLGGDTCVPKRQGPMKVGLMYSCEANVGGK